MSARTPQRRVKAVLAAAAITSGALACGFGAASCGGGQTRANVFSTTWEDDNGRSIEGVRQRLGTTRPALGVDVVVGLTGENDKLLGMPLGAGSSKWTFAHPLDARPVITGSVVVGSGGGEVFALDAKTGARLWVRPTGGLPLHGAGDDGAVTVITFAGAAGHGSTLLAVSHDGHVVRQVETERDLGAPAVLSGLAFVPWGNQFVSVLDLSNGSEAGRLLLREKTSRAFTVGAGLYFGEVGIFRFDEHIKDASRSEASHVTLPTREIPGTPKLMVPGTDALPAAASAPDKIRLYARPSGLSPEPLAVDADRVYATYFKLVMGLTSAKGSLAWVHTHGDDVIGGAAAIGAFVACDEAGRVTVLDAKNGGVVAEQDFGVKLKACVVQSDGYRARGGVDAKAEPLGVQIATALAGGDAQLYTAQRFLLRELSTLDGEQATKTLVELSGDSKTPPDLLVDVRGALSSRRNGAASMLAALAQHYDFLRDILRAPAVGPMAQALMAMNEKRAAPLLASHLLDPASTAEDCKQAASALVVLGSAAEVPALRQFFALYRASADSDEMAAAVVSAGLALLKHGGPEGRSLVDAAAKDPMTVAAAQPRLESIVAAPDAEKPAQGK